MDLIPDISPLPHRTDYQVKLIYPQRISQSNLLAISESFCASMGEARIFNVLVGPEWVPRSYETIRQSVIDPRMRLATLIVETKKYKKLIQLFTGFIHNQLLGDRQIGWELLDSNGNNCGFCLFNLPESMVEEKKQRLGTNSLWFNIYRAFCSLKFKIVKFFKILGYKTDPIVNNNGKPISEERNVLFPGFMEIDEKRREELWKMDEKQLADENERYTFQDTLHLAFYYVDKQHQRKGLGTAFLKHVLDQIPIKPEFNNGPQKVMVIGTELGIPLYEKIGFKMTFDHYYTSKDGVCVRNSRMDMIR